MYSIHPGSERAYSTGVELPPLTSQLFFCFPIPLSPLSPAVNTPGPLILPHVPADTDSEISLYFATAYRVKTLSPYFRV